jgi:hypothetical protein
MGISHKPFLFGVRMMCAEHIRKLPVSDLKIMMQKFVAGTPLTL